MVGEHDQLRGWRLPHHFTDASIYRTIDVQQLWFMPPPEYVGVFIDDREVEEQQALAEVPERVIEEPPLILKDQPGLRQELRKRKNALT